MRSSYFTRLIMVILFLIILLASMVFIGLMLIVLYGGGESELGPLGQFTQWGGQWMYGLFTSIWNWLNQLAQTIAGFFQGI
jgi:hypothetical protein